jgi:mitochondrial distribution and morphology protein 12
MSIDINWQTITSGPDGEALAEGIRSFIHEKFQQVTLPGFIRSVEVHSFDFGQSCPELEIKDIGDPLPDFYDHDDDHDDDGDEGADDQRGSSVDIDEALGLSQHTQEQKSLSHDHSRIDEVTASSLHDASHSRALPSQINTSLPLPPIRTPFNLPDQLGTPFPRSGTPGIPGGTSNLSYFHLPLGGLSGTQTPLAAVASGTNFPASSYWPDGLHSHEQPNATNAHQSHADHDNRSPTRPSTAASLLTSHSPLVETGLPPATSPHPHTSAQIPARLNPKPHPDSGTAHPRPSSPTDLQIITHVKYAGDIRLTLTAEILLDYPMPSFVGIPLKLSITGLTFDGVAVLASVKKNLHFCFLAPEDADVLVGRAAEDEESGVVEKGKGKAGATGKEKLGGLLEEIRVESEIGRKEGGKQVLKNVGKVERFVLEQVRRIFEDEFVWPSFWTFLV